MKTQQSLLYPNSNSRGQDNLANSLGMKKSATGKYVSSIWIFPESEDQLYRWYGTLPRPLIERLISMHVKGSSSRILDPFMGLGTTLDVAANAHLNATGIDNNPLACLAAETLLYGIPTLSLTKILDQIADNLSGLHCRTAARGSDWVHLIEDERYSYTKKWFRKDTLNAILALLFQIAEVQDTRIQRLLFLTTSQIAKEVASVDPRCTHHLVTKKKPFIDPIVKLREKIKRGFATLYDKRAPTSDISIRQGSIFESKLDNNSFDFVLAHPPYLGVIHYHLIHRLATDLLDIVNVAKTPESLRHLDFNYSRIRSTDISTDSADRYAGFVKDFAALMNTVIATDGRCVVIIGDQRHKKHLRHPFTDFIHQFEVNDFALEDIAIWILQNNAGMHIQRRGNFIDHNYLLVFHKQKSR